MTQQIPNFSTGVKFLLDDWTKTAGADIQEIDAGDKLMTKYTSDLKGFDDALRSWDFSKFPKVQEKKKLA